MPGNAVQVSFQRLGEPVPGLPEEQKHGHATQSPVLLPQVLGFMVCCPVFRTGRR
jgi:hypothetical protein